MELISNSIWKLKFYKICTYILSNYILFANYSTGDQTQILEHAGHFEFININPLGTH